jgi:hypothetical protein
MRPDRRPGTDVTPPAMTRADLSPEAPASLRPGYGPGAEQRNVSAAGSSPSPSPSPTLATCSASDTHWPTDCRPGVLPAINSAATGLWGIERRVLDAHLARNNPSDRAGFEIPHQRPSTAPCSAKPFIDAANSRAAEAPPCHDGEGAGPVEWEVDAVLPAAMPDGRSRPRGGCRCSADRLLPLMYEGANGSEVLRLELAVTSDRDRDAGGRPRQVRPRDALGRPLPYGAAGVEPVSEEPLPPSQTVDMARSLVREGRPFAAHEVLGGWCLSPRGDPGSWSSLRENVVMTQWSCLRGES